MDKLLILTILGLQTTLMLMSVITLKSKLNGLEEQIKANTVHIDGQAEKIIANLEEVAQFEEKALGTLAQNMAVCGYELKEIKNNIDSNTKEIKEDIKKSTHTLATTPLKIRV
ncbi:hypothetical protein [Clostridium sp.]|uniref:hypothetical protein n=1 Tax=Clostridium sp. TaxID=1506 RepID=UPI00321624A7